MSDAIDWTIVNRGLAPDASPADRAALAVWQAAHPDARLQIETLRAITSASAALPLASVDAEAALRRLDGRIDSVTLGPPIPQLRTQRPGKVGTTSGFARLWPGGVGGTRAWWRPAAIAASLLVIVALGLAVGAERRGAGRRRLGRAYTTAAAQRLSVTLADGTHLMLAPASHVRLAGDYGGSRRDVYLDGEAYFAVRHDAARPFAVHASAAVAEDIGTRFDIRSYRGDSGVRVVVTEGVVGLSRAPTPAQGDSAPVIVKAGDLALVGLSGPTRVTSGVDPAEYLAWQDGRLVFRDTPLRDVAQMLSRWYGVDVQVGDATLASRAFTATFASEPLHEALGAMCASLQLRYEARGAALVLYPLAHSGR